MPEENSNVRLFDASGIEIQVLGEAHLNIDLGFINSIKHKFLVAEVPNAPIILGSDFIKNFKISINFKNNTIRMGTEKVSLLVQDATREHTKTPTSGPKPDQSCALLSPATGGLIAKSRGQSTAPEIFLQTGCVGTVKWYSVRRGYGFINCHDTNKDVFVHRTAIANRNSNKKHPSLRVGELVYFEVVSGKRGLPQVANLTRPYGSSAKENEDTRHLHSRNRHRLRTKKKSSHDSVSRDHSLNSPQNRVVAHINGKSST